MFMEVAILRAVDQCAVTRSLFDPPAVETELAVDGEAS
jgi:hypothetical protein